MNNPPPPPRSSIQLQDALRLLEDGEPHKLRLWKLSTGDILTYEDARAASRFTRGGTHKVRLPRSGLLREFRDVTLFEIDDMRIYW